MYARQLNKSMTSPLREGQCVVLNPAWSGYDYLRKNFGKMFPAYVGGVKDDIIIINKMPFARHVLAPA